MHSEKSNKEKYKRVEKGLHPIINTGGDTPQMTMIEQKLQQAVADALNRLYSLEVSPDTVVLQATKKEFTGDYTVVVFPYVKQARRSPEQVANELGAMVKESVSEVAGFNVADDICLMEQGTAQVGEHAHHIQRIFSSNQLTANNFAFHLGC